MMPNDELKKIFDDKKKEEPTEAETVELTDEQLHELLGPGIGLEIVSDEN